MKIINKFKFINKLKKSENNHNLLKMKFIFLLFLLLDILNCNFAR